MNKRELKIKKLKKKRIWPAVLMLMVYLFVFAVAMFAYAQFQVYLITDGYIQKSGHTASLLARDYNIALGKGENVKSALEQVNELYIDSIQGVILLDDKGEIVEATVPATIGERIEDNAYYAEEYEAYCDTENRTLNVLFFESDTSLSDLKWQTEGVDILEDQSQTALDITYWHRLDLGQDAGSLLVKIQDALSWKVIINFVSGMVIVSMMMLVPMIILFINVISAIVSQHKVTKLLYWDPMTDGNNWTYVKMNGQKFLRKNRKRDYAILDLELLKYRSFCTCHGVTEGENLLESMNKVLRKKLKSRELMGHHSKANFLLGLVGEKADIQRRVQALFEDLAALEDKHKINFHAGAIFMDSIQRQGFKKSGLGIEDLYQRASSARAAIAGREGNGLEFFSEKMLSDQVWEHKIEDRMDEALEKEEFLVYLQPKYDPVSKKPIAAEALVRWNSPEDGLIPPGRFIPIFEKSSFIKKLDDYMISHVAKLQSEWIAAGKAVVPISVNVSRAHFANPDLADHIKRLVDQYQVPYHCIEIELTESAFFDDKEMLLGTVRKLQTYGFEVSMDDFGAGYSSLNSLKDLPLDILKLDAEFFRGEDASTERGKIVVSEAISLAKRLNMKIVAEGVEKEDQVDFLAETGCDMIQGYYFAKPMPVYEFEVEAFGKNDDIC